ncbi:DUF5667 domain-containing protein [Paraliobacillus sp. JSM ZJ581]|uniref:DUF5667 domain-containing protein n=1 Tax=Paraliobacillus sp. JSM ZJ581 TaxID=3342118 RepID=UPI0035A91917
MKKQLFSVILGAGLLVAGGQVLADEAEEVISTKAELYDTTRLMEEVEYELTVDKIDKAILQDQYATERLKEAKAAIEDGDIESIDQLIKESQANTNQADADLTEAKSTDDDNDPEEVEEIENTLADRLEERIEELTALLEREDLPEQAKINISYVIEKLDNLKERAEQREELQAMLASGEITKEEYKSEMKKLAEKYKEEAKKDKEEALEREEERKEEVEEREEERQEEALEREEEGKEEAAEREKERQEKAKEREEEHREEARERKEEGREKAEEREEEHKDDEDNDNEEADED